MSKNQPPRVQLNFEPDYEPAVASETGKPDIDINIKDVDVQEEVNDMMPEIEEKEQINTKDIFDNLPDEPVEEPVVKVKPVKVKKPRKPMSEEHKQKLAFAREKAMAVRKAKAEEKKKMKALDNEEKELLKTQKIKKVQKLKKEVEEPIEEVVQKTQKVSGLTKKDLEDAQFEAIVKYETLRKQRKAAKKEAEMVEQTKKDMMNKLAPQQYKYRDGSNRWDMCY